MKIKFTFSNGLELVYDLFDTDSAGFFANNIVKLTAVDICPTSLKNGFNSHELIEDNKKRLFEVAEAINSHYPNSVEILYFDDSNWKVSLHQMHTHFPELTNGLNATALEHITPLLGEFNDLIHWLDKEYNRKFNGSELDRSWSTFCLDFNRASACEHMPIPVEDFKYFTHQLYFGNLHLHYDNVGRHPWELFGSNDYTCPPDQVISQTQISPSCNLYFNDWDILRQTKKALPLHLYNEKFRNFYNARGGRDFFKYNITDPQLAVGYMQIGQLENVSDFASITARNHLRNLLADSKPTNWTILL